VTEPIRQGPNRHRDRDDEQPPKTPQAQIGASSVGT
jgi:hypothetical protein